MVARRADAESESLTAARAYLERGWKLVPVPYKAKAPTKPGWQDLDITPRNVEEYFDAVRQNIGVCLGRDSGGLVDVDLDCPEALALADDFLPTTGSVFGRPSKKRAHRLYVTDLFKTESKAVIKYQEPPGLARDGSGAMLVELRIGAGGKGAQTLFPPSRHPSGESITWDTDKECGRVDGDELKQQVALLAAATLLVRHYPASGTRHGAALVLGGVLARAQWHEDDIAWFVEVVAKAAGDEETNDRIEAATSAVELLAAGDDTPGLPRMREEWTDEVANLFARWIGYDANGGTDRNAPPPSGVKQTDIIIALAEEAELFHSRDGVCYADVPANGHRETWPLNSKGSGGFAQWLRHRFYQATGAAPNPTALTAALSTLAAMALYDGPVHEVYVRIAAVDDRVYLDLCDEDWRVIEIDTKDWRVVTDPPVRFLRRRGMLPLPMPSAHPSAKSRREAIDKLEDYVNAATDDDFCLLVSYLLAALRGRGPFVVLLLMGEPGAAKTTLARMLKALVDPNKAPLRAPPREARDLFVAANNSFLIAFDNFSDLPDWLSDMMCRLATGGGFGTRQLYTDDDEMLFDAMRPVALTCIDNVVVRGDLTDRAVFLTLPAIPEKKRRHERDFWAAFERDKPAILGALLDIVAGGLRELPRVKLEGYPRMADFAEWATACEQAASDVLWEAGLFAAAYDTNRARAAQLVIEEDLVANAIRRLMARQQDEPWRGTTKALLEELSEIVGETIRQHRSWPKAPNALARRMNKASGVLRKIGIKIAAAQAKKTNRRLWRISKRNDGA